MLSLNFGINYGAHKTKEDITFKNGIWEKNAKAQTGILEVLIGAIILDNNKFKIIYRVSHKEWVCKVNLLVNLL